MKTSSFSFTSLDTKMYQVYQIYQVLLYIIIKWHSWTHTLLWSIVLYIKDYLNFKMCFQLQFFCTVSKWKKVNGLRLVENNKDVHCIHLLSPNTHFYNNFYAISSTSYGNEHPSVHQRPCLFVCLRLIVHLCLPDLLKGYNMTVFFYIGIWAGSVLQKPKKLLGFT